jgi:hypothetical protein
MMTITDYATEISELLSSDDEDQLEFSTKLYPDDGVYILKDGDGQISRFSRCYRTHISDNATDGIFISCSGLARFLYKIGDISDLIEIINTDSDYYSFIGCFYCD